MLYDSARHCARVLRACQQPGLTGLAELDPLLDGLLLVGVAVGGADGPVHEHEGDGADERVGAFDVGLGTRGDGQLG